MSPRARRPCGRAEPHGRTASTRTASRRGRPRRRRARAPPVDGQVRSKRSPSPASPPDTTTVPARRPARSRGLRRRRGSCRTSRTARRSGAARLLASAPPVAYARRRLRARGLLQRRLPPRATASSRSAPPPRPASRRHGGPRISPDVDPLTGRARIGRAAAPERRLFLVEPGAAKTRTSVCPESSAGSHGWPSPTEWLSAELMDPLAPAARRRRVFGEPCSRGEATSPRLARPRATG